MAYLNHAHDPARRTKAIIGVGAIHAGLAYLLITGLGTTIVEQFVPPPLVGTQIPLPPPPPPKPEPTPERDPVAVDPVAPVPPIPLPPTPGPTYREFDETEKVIPTVGRGTEIVPTIRPDPVPSPGFTPARARPRNNPGSWLTPDDYPRAPLVEGVEGSAAYRLIVSTNGKVSACEITRSTGNPQLDAATCRYIERRARFEPATDETGAKVMGSFTGNVKWEIPE
jgi:protein TonB